MTEGPVRQNVIGVEPKLSRKEKQHLDLRERTFKKLEENAKVIEENPFDPTKPRQRTSVTGFWRKRKEAAKRCVFVGNMPLDITEGELRDFFSEAGVVECVRWLTAGNTSQMGYIQFPDNESCERACANDGVQLRGLTLRVNMADDKTQRKEAIQKRDGMPEVEYKSPQPAAKRPRFGASPGRRSVVYLPP
ncbi:Nucleolin 2 [Diplonema papillatum]|nr:Nucleolin 2 [Diplonema papillatum]